tara:strand:- start:51 stop:941 length:891 start_codon:yes stop_codon:yes gene_type:complete
MEKNETINLDDRGFIQIKGEDAKDFLQNIVTNNVEKVSNTSTIFSSILTPQGKYLFEFFILKINEGYLLECDKEITTKIIELLKIYKLRSKITITDLTGEYLSLVITLEKFKKINNLKVKKGLTSTYQDDLVYIDPRNEKLGAKIVLRIQNLHSAIVELNLEIIDKKKYYEKSFELGIPQKNLFKLKDKIFGIENNLDELGGIDFKKGCYIGQENTSRIKLRNKLRRRILPIQKISGQIFENNIIKYKDIEVGKIIIDEPYPFALIKIVDPDLKEFLDIELKCEKSKIKILKPSWI